MPQTNRPQAKRHIRDPVTVWNNPRAYALCDGCKFLTYRDQLVEQMDYRGGTAPVWTGFLVCPQCNDTPNAQFAPPILKPDPVPVYMPRPDDTDGTTVNVTATPYPLVRGTTIALINVPAPATVNLWTSPRNFDAILIEDTSGDALVNNITIVPAAGLINGHATYVIAVNNGIAQTVYQNGGWWVNQQ